MTQLQRQLGQGAILRQIPNLKKALRNCTSERGRERVRDNENLKRVSGHCVWVERKSGREPK